MMGFDKTKSYKLKNGEFVERTPAEQAELARKRAAQLAAAGRPLGATGKAGEVPKSEERFIRVTLSQANRLLTLNPPAFVTIYLVLSLESFKAHGLPFTFPGEVLADKYGFNRLARWRAVLQLEKAGLISVERVPPKPPKIRVL
jgi:hypothetical protein